MTQPPDDHEPSDDVDAILVRAMRDVRLGRGLAATDLESLFSDAAIDRLLRAVPCPPDAIGRMLEPRHGRRVVDLGAVSGRLGEAAAESVQEIRPRSTTAGAGVRRFLRASIRGGMEAAAVAALLVAAIVIVRGGGSPSRWLVQPSVTRSSPTPPMDSAARAVGQDRGLEPAVEGGVAARDVVVLPSSADSSNPLPADHVPHEGGGDSGVGGGLADAGRSRASAADGPAAIVEAASEDVRTAPSSDLISGDSIAVMSIAPARSAFRGIPAQRGYDLAFEMAHGEQPFIDPSVAAALAVDRPPLSRRTESFDAAVRAAVTGGAGNRRSRQAIESLRTEEVLASLPCQDAPAPAGGGLTLTMSGFPAFRSLAESRLLEVRVSLPRQSRRDGAVGERVVVLDASAAAAAEEAWPSICRGLRDAAATMDDSVRTTVVLFADRPVLAAARASRGELAALCDRLERLRVRGGGDLRGCMPLVHRVIDEAAEGRPARCVVVAHVGSIARAERDGDPDLTVWRSARAGGDEATPSPIEYVVIDPARGEAGGLEGRREDRRDVSPIDGVGLDAAVIRRSVADAIAGGDEGGPSTPAIVRDCRLEVAFDPKRVAAYRLVGHRQRVVDLGAGAPPSIELAGGESVRVVYEVVLRQPAIRSDGGPPVARAVARWRRPGESVDRVAEASISAARLFVDPPAEEPRGWAPWLAVGLAEWAAGSPHVESRAEQLRLLEERVAAWGGAATSDPSLRRLVLLLQTAVERGGPRTSRPPRMTEFDEVE